MNKRSMLPGAVLVGLLLSLVNVTQAVSPQEAQKIEDAAPSKAPAEPKSARKLLVFTLCNDFKHSSIPYCTKALQVIGQKTGAFEVTQSDDMSVFKAENLRQFDAVCLNNTTKLDFSDAALRQSLMDFVRGGKGLIGIHAATDNFYDWPEAAGMMGGLFDGHPWGASGTWAVKIDEPGHPLTAAFGGEDFKISDEIYRTKGFSRWKLRMLLSLDLTDPTNLSVEGIKPSDKDIPISWVRSYDAGRVFYCSLGHNHDVYWNPAVLRHYLAGIQFALGDLQAETTPSVEKAFQGIARYQFGQSRRALSSMDEYLRCVYDSAEILKKIEKRFLQLLGSDDTTDPGRQYICRKLGVIGTEESVATLAAMLTEKATSDIEPSDIARYALERISGPVVDEALRKALDKTSGNVKAGIINSLGVRRDAKSVGTLRGLILDSDAQIAAAAIAALGQIADAAAAEALAGAREKVSGQLRMLVLDAYLNCADNFISKGKTKRGVKIYNELYAEGMPLQIRIAALNSKVASAKSNRGLRIVSKALKSDDPQMQTAAISLTRQMPGRVVTMALAGLFDELSGSGKVQLLSVLADRDDQSSLPIVLKAVKSQDAEVRVAALAALGQLGDASHVGFLAEKAATTEGPDQQAARESLYRIGGLGADHRIMTAIASAEPAVKVELIRSVGRRGISKGVQTLLETATNSNADVRLESLRVLRDLAEANRLHALIGLLLDARTDADRNEAENTVAAVAGKIKDKSQQADGIVAVLSSTTDPARRSSLLRVLGRIRGDDALKSLRSALNEPEPEVRATAIRVLSEWSDAKPAPDLLKAAQSADDKIHRTLALRGYIRLIGLGSDRSADETFGMYKKAMELASSSDEKKMVLSGLANVRTLPALEMAGRFLDDMDLQQEAAVAILRIAEGTKDSNPQQTRAVLEKVLRASQNESVRKQASKLIKQIQ